MGRLSPRVVISDDQSFAIYTAYEPVHEDDPAKSWEEQGIVPGTVLGVPTIHLVDLERRDDSTFERGAYSAAISSTGQIAYAVGVVDELQAGVPYASSVVVSSTDGAQSVSWSVESAEYVVAAWAGDELLVYKRTAIDGEQYQLVALDGLGGERLIADGGILGALDESGRHAFLVTSLHTDSADPDAAMASIVDLATAAVVSSFPARDLAASGVKSLAGNGEWRDGKVIVGGAPGPAVFDVTRTISFESTIALDNVQFPFGAHRVSFATDATIAILWTDAPVAGSGGAPGRARTYETRSLMCDRIQRSCKASRPGDPLTTVGFDNPSRPRS